MPDDLLVVGEVVRPQGLRGELKIRPHTCDPDRFFDLKYVLVDGKPRALHCNRVHDGFAYARLEGIYSREAAESMRGAMLHIRREDAVALPEDTDFICDLIGCVATDTEGVAHGRLVEVLQPGGVDVYMFKGTNGILMVPALKKVMIKVDTDAKQILLDAQGLRETAVYD